MNNLFLSLRPWQWIKNLLIFVPYLLTNKSFDYVLVELFFAFLLFSLFVSSTYLLNDIKDREIETFIINCFGDCIKKNYKPKKEISFELNNLWINENKKGSSNTAHTHPLSDFSGVYYVEVPKDSGLISFQHFNIHDQNLGHYFYDSEFYDAFNIFNKKYQFLIFPSTYVHRVNPSNSLKSRISISFNVSIIK